MPGTETAMALRQENPGNVRMGVAQKRGIQDRGELIRLLLAVMLGGIVPR